MRRRNQDGSVGRRAVSVSPKLGCLQAAGEELWQPRRCEEPQGKPVGCRGTEGGGEVKARQDWHPWGWGDQERQVGGTLREEQERSWGWRPHPLGPGEPAGLPGEVPCPLRPGVGGTPGPLLFLEPKPHPPEPPGPFPALWVLSIGPAHHPNLTLA